ISPSSPVIVVGDGKEGSGEEGRLAWTLLYLGAPDVQIADVDALKLRFSNEVPPPRENAATWEPDVRESIVADRREVLDAIAKKSKTFILDVRTKNEYFSKTPNLQYELPDLGAIHMPWTEFLTDEGRPNL